MEAAEQQSPVVSSLSAAAERTRDTPMPSTMNTTTAAVRDRASVSVDEPCSLLEDKHSGRLYSQTHTGQYSRDAKGVSVLVFSSDTAKAIDE